MPAHSQDRLRRGFLLLLAIALVPVALSYGADPAKSLQRLYGITVEGTNLTHIFRAYMGLYLAASALWLAGAFDARLRRPALITAGVFMLGIAAGRLLSLAVDGMPDPKFVAYLAIELAAGTPALLLARGAD
ncbi:MAG: DUF4345 domain-containing protein [Pseudohaliea sp.]